MRDPVDADPFARGRRTRGRAWDRGGRSRTRSGHARSAVAPRATGLLIRMSLRCSSLVEAGHLRYDTSPIIAEPCEAAHEHGGVAPSSRKIGRDPSPARCPPALGRRAERILEREPPLVRLDASFL